MKKRSKVQWTVSLSPIPNKAAVDELNNGIFFSSGVQPVSVTVSSSTATVALKNEEDMTALLKLETIFLEGEYVFILYFLTF